MRMVDLIQKKRNGESLTEEEIKFIIKGYTEGEIPDYQMSAWAMAVYFQGMSKEETAELTMAMVRSGDQIDLSPINGIKVDKHSTGGVGDTTTIVLAPLVASCGVPVAKMSGRGLGHTGGTIDKLESFKGFSVEIEKETFVDMVNEHKVAVVGQSGNLTPADKMLYALRDVTATVDIIPLIASSIMSKKIAAGADAIVLDVKTGSGAFMKSVDEAQDLARAMVSIGKEIGRETTAIISDMSQPLGKAVGNALEIKEAIDTLQGKGPRDLEELCLTLGSHMLTLAGKADSIEAAREQLVETMQNGQALDTLANMVEAQGGYKEQVYDPDQLPQASDVVEVTAPADGYIEQIDAEEIGRAASKLGAGRETKESKIDLAVGVMLQKKVGEQVKKGDVLVSLHYNQESHVKEATDQILQAYRIADSEQKEPSLIYDVIK
ncbi:pyrimidine-nucleoside phosphorylase [Caldalkalibacillus salinus]|uniref:pyrimidine-nucleoside phosphorylase n=1 Tax=Caldalkalibacillus salinus TaxID=2803787 RepID=UPI00192307F6|nr:pyrimidine-nucleoside phosphorylase [Caldalkalibacillus salinus]